MAWSTPLPSQRDLSPSLFSTASWAPVEAPDGTAARPRLPSSSKASTSTVGLPRLSRIWRAWRWMMAVISLQPRHELYGGWTADYRSPLAHATFRAGPEREGPGGRGKLHVPAGTDNRPSI